MDNNGELSEKELEFAQGGQRGKYEDNKERFESAMNKFKPVPEELKQDRDLVQASIENNLEPGELTEEQLSHVEAGNGLSYADNKKRMEESLGAQLGELSEEDLERYEGGIRIEGQEYYQQR